MIDRLLDAMTLEQQVSLLSGADFWTTASIPQLGVPSVKFTDGPNGARGAGSLAGGVKATCFPVAVALGATWNPALVEQMSMALAGQVKSKGAAVVLAPTVNIQRTGLNGRNFECYSEDPTLTAVLAAAYIRGVQSQGVAATIKHFVGNESEIDRQTMSSDIGERALREIYLPPFEHAVKKAGVMAVMSSYNRLNGIYTSENQWLLTTILRDEWRFDGIVMSDWFGSHSTIASIEAGLDLEMPGPTRDRGDKLVRAVRSGEVEAKTVRRAARRILTLIERLGAFQTAPEFAEHAIDRPEDRALIRRLGAESAVLLKNDGILPLAKDDINRLAVIGPNAAEAYVTGGGSAQINTHYKITPLEGIRATVPDAGRLLHAVGCSNNRLTRIYRGKVDVEYFTGRACHGIPVHTETCESGEFLWFDLPARELDVTDFSVRFTATFVPQEGGEYVIGMTNAGLAKLYVNNELIVNGFDNWSPAENYFGTANSEQRALVNLDVGVAYNIVVEYASPTTATAGVNLTGVRFGVEKPLGDDAITEAVEVAQNAEVILLFVGRNDEWDMEGLDLPDLRLPGRQEELIEKVAAVNPNTVIILQSGGPIEMPWLSQVKAVLQMWYPGQELGHAVADVLFGDAEPGGRLPQTFPKQLTDNSAITTDAEIYPGKDGHVRYTEGIFVGYRHFCTQNIEPLFPFGFGLGYTNFHWGTPSLSCHEMGVEGITVKLKLTNSGARDGSEVVQLYVRSPTTKVERPDKELRSFAKLSLPPGVSEDVLLSIGLRDLSYFDETLRAFVAEAGDYELLVASHVNDVRFRVKIHLRSTWYEPVKKIEL